MTEKEIEGQLEWFESLLEMVEAGKTEAVREAIIAAIKILTKGAKRDE